MMIHTVTFCEVHELGRNTTVCRLRSRAKRKGPPRTPKAPLLGPCRACGSNENPHDPCYYDHKHLPRTM
eukprot:5988966-Pyramimonas_sp.AAC.1